MTEGMTTALGTAFTAVSADVTSALGTILPIALGIAGTIWVLKRVFRWFSGMSGGGRG